MINLYSHQKAEIVKVAEEAAEIKRFWLRLESPLEYRFGQFILLRIPGFSEAPFVPCGERVVGGNKQIELVIRRVGILTGKLHQLKKGAVVEIRGPFGNGVWPADSKKSRNRNVLIVAGGLGLIPVRSLIFDYINYKPDYKMQIFYGARTPDDMIFREDFNKWRKMGIDLQLTIDKEYSGWNGYVGVVTDLFEKTNVVRDARCFMCGPPIMYKFVLEKLKEHKFKEKDIYLSLERRMHCGVGVCQHCAIGSDYVCKDGPVFRWDEIKMVYKYF